MVYYLKEYMEVIAYIEMFPKAAVAALQNAMKAKGVSQAGLAKASKTTQVKISRVFSGAVKLKPDEAQHYARCLGGILRMGTDGELVFDNDTEPLSVLIAAMQEEDTLQGKQVIAHHEIPVALCNALNIDAKDFYIFLEGPGTEENFPDGNVLPAGYVIVIESQREADVSFVMLVSQDGKTAAFEVWLRHPKFMSDIVDYRRLAGVDEDDLAVLEDFEKECRGWVPYTYIKNAVFVLPVDIEMEGEFLYQELGRAFDSYEALVKEQTGVGFMRTGPVIDGSVIDRLDAMKTVTVFSGEDKESVLDVKARRCEIDPDHELFEGEDGAPYVEVATLIPIKPETTKQYGNKLKLPANTVVLCPMCASKLEHASWRIKEEMLMSLYEQKIEEMKDNGLDVSRFEVLSARQPKSEVTNKSSVSTSQARRLSAYAQRIMKMKGGSE